VVCMVRRKVQVLDPAVSLLQVDLLQPDLLEITTAQVGSVDVVFHMGAIMSQHATDDPGQLMLANGVATARLLRAAIKMSARAFVYASGVTVIGKPEQLPVRETHPLRPTYPYHLSKLCGELACEQARRTEGLNVTSLRITSPYGLGKADNSVLPRFVKRALASESLNWFGTGKRTQNFVHVSDIVRACLKASEAQAPGVYNIGGQESISMKNLARLIQNLTPGCGSKVCEAGKPDPQEDHNWEVSLSKAYDGLGYAPKVSFEQGLREYIEGIRCGDTSGVWFYQV